MNNKINFEIQYLRDEVRVGGEVQTLSLPGLTPPPHCPSYTGCPKFLCPYVQGDQNLKYNDYNDTRQKITKYELEIDRLRQDSDR